jgi:hypothetical protein
VDVLRRRIRGQEVLLGLEIGWTVLERMRGWIGVLLVHGWSGMP